MEAQRSLVHWVAAGVFAVLVLGIIFGSFGNINTGNVGIHTRFGKMVGSVQPGLYFKLPFIDNIVSMDVQTQKEEVKSVEAASADLQTVNTNVAVNFHLSPDAAPDIFKKVGSEYVSRIIDPAIQESVKATTAKYTAEELITKRELVREGIIDLLKSKMDQFSLTLDSLNITNFDFSPNFNEAIELKVTAEQNALAAKNKVEQANYEAQAIKIKSEAANNEKYIQLQTLEVQRAAVEKWNGVLPQQFVPGSALPFLNLK